MAPPTALLSPDVPRGLMAVPGRAPSLRKAADAYAPSAYGVEDSVMRVE